MASFNSCTLVGNVTRDIELKYTPSGTAVTTVGLALNHKYKDSSGNWQEDATFVDCDLFGRTAEIANEYLRKGSQCLISGRLKLDTWDDAKSGQKRSKLKVVGQQLQLLGGKGGGTQQREPLDHGGYDTRPPAGDVEVPF